VELPDVEPWPEPVNGAELMNRILEYMERFVIFPKWAGVTFTLWSVHTFAYYLRDLTAYLGIESPDRECGKSTLLSVLSEFVNRAVVSSNISSSAFFRAIEDLHPTLLIDEGDTNLRGKSDLRGILNAGYTKRTAFVWRISYDREEASEGNKDALEAKGPAGRVVKYSCWGPKAIASIGALHPTLASRCIVVRMQRKIEGEKCERLKHLDTTDLKRMCVRFVMDREDRIRRAEPEIPLGLTNRAADLWEQLFVLADEAGGPWPKLAREAAIGLTAQAQEYSPMGALLLDIFVCFIDNQTDRLFSRDLVATLVARNGRPWGELINGKKMTEHWLAQRLRAYGIKSRTLRIGEEVSRGYVQEDFMETFKRYIPKAEIERMKADLAARREMPPTEPNSEGGETDGKGGNSQPEP
jgi:hypothetical protein